jgi:hypothetical protein
LMYTITIVLVSHVELTLKQVLLDCSSSLLQYPLITFFRKQFIDFPLINQW